MHIDGTFIPLGPGKILVNPKRPCITGNHKSFFTYEGETKVRGRGVSRRFQHPRSASRSCLPCISSGSLHAKSASPQLLDFSPGVKQPKRR